uniref:ABI gene family member 3 n=1 Tax=Latimeria chalumnae TaxID=7897 RepID=H3AKD6_LATCH
KEEIQTLLQQEIPSARQALLDNYSNLHKVAEYCETNYIQLFGFHIVFHLCFLMNLWNINKDKSRALEETKMFTAQSLASVAYQINTLAKNVLKLLDLQAAEFRNLESSVTCVSQQVDMYKEKVARREIGALTVGKKLPRTQKIIRSEGKEMTMYSRKPIAYSALDEVGHGIKKPFLKKMDIRTQLGRTGTMARKPSANTSGASHGTLGRSVRIPEPVQPPTIPESKISKSSSVTSLASLNEKSFRHNNTSRGARKNDAYGSDSLGIPVSSPVTPTVPMESTSPLPPPPPPPPSLQSHVIPPPPSTSSEMPLPPPMPTEVPMYQSPTSQTYDDNNKKEPQLKCPCSPITPSHGGWLYIRNTHTDFQAPPPPPPIDYLDFEDAVPPPPPPVDYDTNEPEWVPRNYIRKVVALYPYSQTKADELSFKKGNVIYITRKNADGWDEGTCNGVSGFFPANYVESFV